MLHPLFGVRLKLVRALEQLDMLHTVATKFLGTNPYGLGFEHYRDEGSGDHRVRAVLTVREQPPMGYGLLLDEAIHHARGSLDHLVYQLALLNTSRPAGAIQWPTALDETEYWTTSPGKKSPRDRMLEGVSESYRTVIDAHQPYKDGPLSTQHRLYVLSRFDNLSKHRVIQTGFGLPDRIKVEPTQEGVELDVRIPLLTAPVEEGTEIFSVRWIEGYEDVPMRYEAAMTLAYGSGLAVFVRRYYILETVEIVHEIINDFTDRVPEFRGG